MGLLDHLFKKPTPSAKNAKERLQIVISHQRDMDGRNHKISSQEEPAFMEEMKSEILKVVQKYIKIAPEDIETSISKDNGIEVLTLDINIPDAESTKTNDHSYLK